MSRVRQKRIIVGRNENFQLLENQHSSEGVANRLLLQSGIPEGTHALVKYSHGKLKVSFPNEINKQLKRFGEYF